MDKKFRAIKDIFILDSKFGLLLAYEGAIITPIDWSRCVFAPFGETKWNRECVDMLFKQGYLEEIIEPNKTQNLSESNNPYGRQIYLAEAIHALTNHDVLIKDKYGYIWDYDKIDETFYTYGEDGYTVTITDKYTVKEILELQFDAIPKLEDVKQKWIEISCSKELCNAISNGKIIRVGNGVPMEKYNDKQITTLFGTLNQGIIKLEYLEED